MLRKSHLAVYLVFLISALSCGNKKNIPETIPLTQDQVAEKLLEANKESITTENNQINKLVDSTGWKVVETATGLRYTLLEKGKGPRAIYGQIARIEFEVKLISGETLYSSEQTGPKEFIIGRGGVESGLEEGILLLRVGDKARLIIPSYLAHGLSGDQDKIPPKATLIYTVKLIELKSS
jgi:FKBP-type peptidyl-prolyl cis-trans isomerase FkpA